MAKEKTRLSISKPVRWARSNRLGGFQYSGTNRGSVRPKGAVSTLDQSMRRRSAGRATNSNAQGTKKAADQISQAYL